MQGASRESYAAARAELDGLTDSAALATAADEILSVGALLAREPRLRRALSDPARSGQQRSGLLLGLVGEQIGETARQLLGTLVGGRWSSPAELRNGVEALGVEALIVSADRAGELGEVEDELFRFGQIVAGSPELAASIGDSTASADRRDELVEQLLGGKAKPATVVLTKQALRGFGGRSFAGALNRLVELCAEERDRSVAYVTVAEALSDAEEERLGAALSQRYGRQVAVKVVVDPAVLGGARVRIGSDLYDGTVARRLAEARNALASR
jgi:F-type H+-transporting ATPase subunit delta